jgi:ribosomal protein S18 acetylase RimI-like enzyme
MRDRVNKWLSLRRQKMTLRIRNSKPQDFEELIPLLKQLWPDKAINEAKLRRVFERCLESTIEAVYCAEAEGKVVGFCSATISNNYWQEGYIAYISTIVVDEKHRNQGIGKLLTERVCEFARSKGCGSVELDSAFHRAEAHRFYENLGFEKRAYTFSREL